MTRNRFQIVTMTAVLGLLGVFAVGQTTTTPNSGDGHQYRSAGDIAEKPAKLTDEMGKEMKDKMAKLPDDMKMRCQMQMNMEVSPSDPSAILALKDQLQLTTDQATELQAISKEARTKAAAVLNPDQQTTLGTLPQTPQTMKALHEKMTSQMHPMKATTPGDKPMDCPMMQMMQENTASTMPPKTNSPEASAEVKPNRAPASY